MTTFDDTPDMTTPAQPAAAERPARTMVVQLEHVLAGAYPAHLTYSDPLHAAQWLAQEVTTLREAIAHYAELRHYDHAGRLWSGNPEEHEDAQVDFGEIARAALAPIAQQDGSVRQAPEAALTAEVWIEPGSAELLSVTGHVRPQIWEDLATDLTENAPVLPEGAYRVPVSTESTDMLGGPNRSWALNWKRATPAESLRNYGAAQLAVAPVFGPEHAEMVDAVCRAGPAEWTITAPMTAEEHGAEFARTVRETAAQYGVPDEPRSVHWLSVRDGLALAYVGSSPNSPHLAQALTGAWNSLVSLAQAHAEGEGSK